MATAPIIDASSAGGEAVPTRLTAIVVNYRTPELALACLRALQAEIDGRPGADILLVDGGSGDGSAERLAAALAEAPDERVELLALPINGGFGYANNQALLRLAARPMPPACVFLVNPDARVLPGAIARLANLLAAHPQAAAAGAQLQDASGEPQGSAFPFPSVRGEFCRGAGTDILRRLLRQPPPVIEATGPEEVPWVTGAAVMLRMGALAHSGLFDDGFFLYFEEVELLHRLRAAGWQVWHDPGARVTHLGGGATDIKWDAAGFHKRQPLPRYWYASRRRYFARTGGSGVALLAGIAFLAGRAVWMMRRLVQRRRDGFPLHTARDTARHSLWPSRADRRGHVPRFGDAPGAEPGWMEDAVR